VLERDNVEVGINDDEMPVYLRIGEFREGKIRRSRARHFIEQRAEPRPDGKPLLMTCIEHGEEVLRRYHLKQQARTYRGTLRQSYKE